MVAAHARVLRNAASNGLRDDVTRPGRHSAHGTRQAVSI
jgi:hypothetical protein